MNPREPDVNRDPEVLSEDATQCGESDGGRTTLTIHKTAVIIDGGLAALTEIQRARSRTWGPRRNRRARVDGRGCRIS